MEITYLFKREYIKQAVIQETSYVAERQQNMELPQYKDGRNNLFEQLFIFDDHQETLFARYFNEAYARLIMHVPTGYIIEVEEPAEYEDGDKLIGLEIPDYTSIHRDALKVEMDKVIINYIIWQWLATKLPQLAIVFFNSMETAISNSSKLMRRRTRMMRRKPSFP